MWGEIQDGMARVYVLQPLMHKSTRMEICYSADDLDYEFGGNDGKMMLLGTIHTHPNAWCVPSVCDIETAIKDGEICYGILSLFTWKHRKFTALGFWGRNGNPLQTFIGEKFDTRAGKPSRRNPQ